jgi:hypothetical protein
MRAVWSFWSRPFQSYYQGNWCNPLYHLLSWVVSVHAARQHYPETALVTDRAGKRLLVEQLGLPFSEVSTALERLREHDPGWWALGKIVAYGVQTSPFIHIDSDVYLWKRLPEHLEAAPVFGQWPEHFVAQQSYYRPEDIEAALNATGGILPVEWEWARSCGPDLRAENCGIIGGTEVAFLRHYARTALELVERPENAAAWQQLPDKRGYNIVVEQFLLAACVGYHRYHRSSPFRGVRTEYLFSSWEDGLDPQRAARAGFTHLMGCGKTSAAVGQRLVERVRREYPNYLRRCERVASGLA